MGILEVLLVAFIIMKVAGVIAWSWWAVLIPLWIMIVLYVILPLLGISIIAKFRDRL